MNEEAARQEVPVDAVVVVPTTPKKSRTVEGDMKLLAQWLYTNNPFYVVSAALMFVGLRMSFDTGGPAFQTGALMAGLTVYTLLLAATAWFLIRYGDLWQDVRTLLVLVVLLLLATSISFDRSLVELAELRIPLAFGGLVFAVAVSELLLRGIRLRLPIGFRLPYYAVLALFFLYPAATSTLAGDADSAVLKWMLFGFSTLAGMVFLTLLPAIRRGADYVSDNGSPWRWPWYPWVLFGALGLGVCLRAYYLCISFHAVDGSRTIFGLYFLVPFLWVAAFLLLEIGIVSRRKPVTYVSLLAPIGLVAMALTASPDKAGDLGFLQLFRDALGCSPLFMSLMLAIVFYIVAWARGAAGALIGFFLAAAAFSICGADTFNPNTISGPHAPPILIVGIVLLGIGLRKRRAERCLFGAWCVVLALWIAFRGTSFTAYSGAIPVHLLLACALVVGALFRDAVGRAIQTLGAVALLAFALIAALCPARLIDNPPQAIATYYPLSVAAFAVVYGFAVKNSWYYATAIGSLFGWSVVPGWNSFVQLRRALAGLSYIAWGAASFFVALLVSLLKMGVLQRLYARWRGKE